MLDQANVPEVEAGEQLSRFILFSKWFRAPDGAVKPEAFMPHPHVALSMMRHRDASEDEIWTEGRRVAGIRTVTLYGRADVGALTILSVGLTVVPDPILPENPNHVNVVGYPEDKPEQKLKALEVAARAEYKAQPDQS